MVSASRISRDRVGAGHRPVPPPTLAAGARPVRPARTQADQSLVEQVDVPAGTVTLPGLIAQPARQSGLVVFAHGSGSGRLSPRNQYVARVLNDAGLATLLFDLLTPAESDDRRNVFDIGLLAARLAAAITWARHDLPGLPVGAFGASTGAAAALCAAADPALRVRAVVSRGGRPDLAEQRLAEVTAPTLLIVGGDDTVVLDLNRDAYDHLTCIRQLAVVPGATHLFSEPGALESAAGRARDWFLTHLGGPHQPAALRP